MYPKAGLSLMSVVLSCSSHPHLAEIGQYTERRTWCNLANQRQSNEEDFLFDTYKSLDSINKRGNRKRETDTYIQEDLETAEHLKSYETLLQDV